MSWIYTVYLYTLIYCTYVHTSILTVFIYKNNQHIVMKHAYKTYDVKLVKRITSEFNKKG